MTSHAARVITPVTAVVMMEAVDIFVLREPLIRISLEEKLTQLYGQPSGLASGCASGQSSGKKPLKALISLAVVIRPYKLCALLVAKGERKTLSTIHANFARY